MPAKRSAASCGLVCLKPAGACLIGADLLCPCVLPSFCQTTLTRVVAVQDPDSEVYQKALEMTAKVYTRLAHSGPTTTLLSNANSTALQNERKMMTPRLLLSILAATDGCHCMLLQAPQLYAELQKQLRASQVRGVTGRALLQCLQRCQTYADTIALHMVRPCEACNSGRGQGSAWLCCRSGPLRRWEGEGQLRKASQTVMAGMTWPAGASLLVWSLA